MSSLPLKVPTTVVPMVTVIVPCRNEAEHIESCIGALLALESPAGGFEVVVVDGMSTDGTREILDRLERSVSAQSLSTGSPGRPLRVINNPGMIVSKGLNIAIRAANGAVIVRADAHTEYAPDYLLRCVEALNESGADNVGGPWIAQGRGYLGHAIAAAFQSPFAVGSVRGHNPNYEGYVDTVYLGCWRRATFDRVGYFDEDLVRNQDDEHNLRIIRGGGRIWQSLKIRSWYLSRDTLRTLFTQYGQYGYWKVRVIQKHRMPGAWRHVVPGGALLVVFLLGLTAAVQFLISVNPAPCLWLLLWSLAVYCLYIIAASVLVARRAGWQLLPVLPLTFACYHLSYGLGFWCGVWDFTLQRRTASVSFSQLSRTAAAVPGLQSQSSFPRVAGTADSCARLAAREPALESMGAGSADASASRPLESPSVSVIIPCRNEAGHIAVLLRSLLAFEAPAGGFEVIVADGMSNDGTREIIARFQKDLAPPQSTSEAGESASGRIRPPAGAPSFARLRVIDNPGQIVSKGLNAAIRAARGDIIIRLDAHTDYAPDYLRECVDTLKATGADNVGGPARTKADGYLQRAVATTYHSPFSVGGALFHDVNYDGWVDTVTYGCWRKSAFEKFGLFDEELVRNQDDEHNLRITRAGGRNYQSTKIKSWYRPRSSLRALFSQYMQYGYWKVRVIQKHRFPASWRHLVPGAVVLVLLGSFLVAALAFLAARLGATSGALAHGVPSGIRFASAFSYHAAAFTFLSVSAVYSIALFAASLLTAAKTEWKLLPVLPPVFACYHLGYGFGFLRGLLDFVILRRGGATAFGKLTRGSSGEKSVRPVAPGSLTSE